MARFGSSVAMVVNGKRYKAGTTYADSVGNAVAGDIVWAMTAALMNPGLIPLDGTATAMKNASVFASTPVPRIDGSNSIEG